MEATLIKLEKCVLTEIPTLGHVVHAFISIPNPSTGY